MSPGVEIQLVNSAEKAVERLACDRYECMILDLGLGGNSSGYDLLAKD